MRLNNKKIKINTNNKGEISSLTYNDIEILHTTNKSWAKTFPIIWPVLGKSKSFIVNGKEYDIPKHGFWNELEWDQFIENDNLVLSAIHIADERYPFTIGIQQFISLSEDGVQIETHFSNASKETSYFHFGLHPSFKINEESSIEINSKEFAFAIDLNGILTNDRVDANSIISSLKFAEDYDTLVYKGLSTNQITLNSCGHKITMTHDSNNLQIWKTKENNFICLEPWYGVGDYEKELVKNVSEKEEIISLAPGKTWKSKMTIDIKKIG